MFIFMNILLILKLLYDEIIKRMVREEVKNDVLFFKRKKKSYKYIMKIFNCKWLGLRVIKYVKIVIIYNNLIYY